ncbi:MAG: hypothetical protein DI596_03365 [Azospira oryzae]|nr:MAG: hypothetical protein DI596_03365 [Azospira oryzae]PZP81795.1 MAG: hypothetical protein DI593_03365 [Azospira oryzae]
MSGAPDFPLVRHLSAASDPYRDPVARIRWEALSLEDYWLPREALSLFGLAQFDALDEATQRRLSHYEFLGVIRAGVWFEGLFMARLAQRLRRPLPLTRHLYLLRELREEAGHSLMFLTLMEKSGLVLPDRQRLLPRGAEWLGRWLPVDGPLFWLAVLIGEDVPDKLNRYVRQQPEGAVNPAIRDICLMHIIDEARHVAFARRTIEAGISDMRPAGRRLVTPILSRLLRIMAEAVFFPRAELYELAGLRPGRRWQAAARLNPRRREFVQRLLGPTVRLLQGYGFNVRLGLGGTAAASASRQA